MNDSAGKLPVLVAGGGIGGLAAALALTRQGFHVKVLEQAPEIGEIGAGIQLGPNAFHAFDALGVGDKTRARAVYTDYMVMHDAIDEYQVGKIPTGEAFLKRFGNPYAVIHRVDVHLSLLEGAQETGKVEILTSTRAARIEQDADGATVIDQNVVYRAVVDKKDFPENLQWNAASIWVGPNCHLVHYPLRGGEQYNVVVTFHSRQQEEWGVTEGSKEEVQSYFQDICPKARQLIDLPKSWKRWATADREPIGRWSFDRVTLLGDAAHPTTQYMAQGACKAFDLYQRARVARTARIVLSGREMGRIYHAKGVERLVRNDLWRGRTPERYYDAMEWLYGWNVDNCLSAADNFPAQ
ncbi:MAG: 3-hydroxybenzoate 6-monooxygenase [Proteobacteria bacterium]|nr:3-hydroxybenzoate 6-monooxygenase [Pseudomonadota bacterium]